MSERMRLFWRWWAIITGLLFVELAVLNTCQARTVPLLFLALTAAAVAYWLAVGALLGVYRRLYRMWQSRSDGWRIDGRRMVRKERN